MSGGIPAAAVARGRRAGDSGEIGAAPGRGAVAPIVLAVWFGAALLRATTVGQAAFAVLPSRQLAGALVGRVLPVVFLSGIAAGVIAHLLALRAGLRAGWVGRLGGLALVGSCVAAQFVVAPRIEALRAELPAVLESLPPTDPQRRAFGQLHGISVALLGVAMLGAVTTIVATVRAASRRD